MMWRIQSLEKKSNKLRQELEKSQVVDVDDD